LLSELTEPKEGPLMILSGRGEAPAGSLGPGWGRDRESSVASGRAEEKACGAGAARPDGWKASSTSEQVEEEESVLDHEPQYSAELSSTQVSSGNWFETDLCSV
jgi:hypothetical protein